MSSDIEKNEGKLVVISAPSGAGKTTIVKHLLSRIPELEFSVSACSRNQRPGEVHGKDYYFLDEPTFREKINNGEFVEWEEVYPGSFYGTLHSELERIWLEGKHVIFDVDVVGGLNLVELFKPRSIGVFIMPPSVKHLENRLKSRETETPETLARRLAKAEKELSSAPRFDVVIINDNLEEAKEEAYHLVKAFLQTVPAQ